MVATRSAGTQGNRRQQPLNPGLDLDRPGGGGKKQAGQNDHQQPPADQKPGIESLAGHADAVYRRQRVSRLGQGPDTKTSPSRKNAQRRDLITIPAVMDKSSSAARAKSTRHQGQPVGARR